MAFQPLAFVGVRGQKAGNGNIGAVNATGTRTPGNLLLFVHSHTDSFGEFVSEASGWSYAAAANDSAVRINVHWKIAENNSNDNFVSANNGAKYLCSIFEFSGCAPLRRTANAVAETKITGPSSVNVSSSTLTGSPDCHYIYIGTRERWYEASNRDLICNRGTEVFNTHKGDGLQTPNRPGHFVSIETLTDGTRPFVRWEAEEGAIVKNWLAGARLGFAPLGVVPPSLIDLTVDNPDRSALQGRISVDY